MGRAGHRRSAPQRHQHGPLSFDCYLNWKKDQGIALLVRFNDKGNKIDTHTREKFSIGLVGLPYSKEKRLGNILGVHYSTIGQSQFCSLVDIIVGSLRFAINAHTRGLAEHYATAGALLALLGPLLFREEEGPFRSDKVSELGFQFSPKTVTVAKYRAKYDALQQFLAERGVETAQRITDQAQY